MGGKPIIRLFEMYRGFIIKITPISDDISPDEKYYIEYEKYGELLTTDVILKSDNESDILDKFNKSFVLLLDNDLITMFDYNSITMNAIKMWLLSH